MVFTGYVHCCLEFSLMYPSIWQAMCHIKTFSCSIYYMIIIHSLLQSFTGSISVNLDLFCQCSILYKFPNCTCISYINHLSISKACNKTIGYYWHLKINQQTAQTVFLKQLIVKQLISF